MSGLSIDPHILEVAEDYKDLEGNSWVESLKYSDPNYSNEKVFAVTKEVVETSKDESVKIKLVSTWFKCMVDGGIRIFYPQNDDQIRFYYMHFASSYWNNTIIIATIFLLIGPYVSQPVCYVSSSSFENDGLMIFSGFYLCFLLLHLIDFFILWKSSPLNVVFGHASTAPYDFSIQWSIMHLIVTIIIVIDLIVYFSDLHNPRITRCLFPVIYIVKRTNLKSLLGGLYVSVVQTIKVYRLLILVLLLFSSLGFVLFGHNDRLHSNGTHWSTFLYSFLTCLHCSTSRPSVLYRIKALFEAGDSVSVIYFFVALTLFADILFTAIIIGTGSKSYADFKSKYLRTLLKYRKILLDSLFILYADKDGLVSLDSWLRFSVLDLSYCSYHVKNSDLAITLFKLEDINNNGHVNKKSFFALCGMLSTIPYNNSVKGKHESVPGSHKNDYVLRAVDASRSNDTNKGIELPVVTGGDANDSAESDVEDENTTVLEISRLRLNSVTKMERDASVFRLSEISTGYMAQQISFWRRIYKVCKLYSMYYSLVIMGYRIKLSVPLLCTELKFDLALWSCCSAILHILLVVQLCFVSRAGNNRGWEIVGYFFLLYFYIDNLIQYMASSVTVFTSIKDFVVNSTTLLSKIVLSSSAVGSKMFETALTIVILAQSIRSMKLVKFFKGAYLIKAISPIILQVLEILCLIIYLFSIVGHSLFCSVRFIDVPLNTDDDSLAYPNYQEILNFSSNLQSAYTLAVVAVTSNWSMVMNYASRGLSHGLSIIYYPHLFFYSFRLIMFLLAIPLLVSFIIQNFMQQINKRQKDSKESKIKFKVTPKTMFRTTLIKSWSLSTRETMSAPAVLPEMQLFQRLLDTLAVKYKILQEYRAKMRAPSSDVYRSDDRFKKVDKCIYEIYDPEIMAHLSYWVDLYNSATSDEGKGKDGANQSESDDLIASVQHLFNPSKYPEIAYLWLNDAGIAHSRRISIPTSGFDLLLYKLSRSDVLHSLCTVLIVVQIILVLSYTADDCGFSPRDVQANIQLTIIDFIFIWIHLLESSSNAYLTLSKNFKSAFNWHCFRFFCCSLILIDCILFLAVQDSVRFSRCLFVVLVLSRILDLKHYVHSLAIAMRKNRMLYTLLLFFLLVLSMEGFLLFQRFKLDPSESRFSNLGMSIASVLHSFTSTPFGLLILKPYFKLSPVSSLFWLTITYALEILGINLLVAVGANQYQKSFDHQVERRRTGQRIGVINAWHMLSVADSENGTRRLTKENWLKMVAIASESSVFNDVIHLIQYAIVSHANIAALFGISDSDCPLRARLQEKISHGSRLFDYIDSDNKGHIGCIQDFFRLVALHLNNVHFERVLHLESDISKSDHDSFAPTKQSNVSLNQFVPPISSSKLLHLSKGPLESFWKSNNIKHYRLFLPRVKSHVSNVFYNISPLWMERISKACKYIVSSHVRLSLRQVIFSEIVTNPVIPNDVNTPDRHDTAATSLKLDDSVNIGFFNIINIVMHIVLASQLFNSIISPNYQVYSEVLCGINVYFCVSMVVKMIAMGGENLYRSYYVHRFDFYINVFTALACAAQSIIKSIHGYVIFPVILLLQMLRFRKIFWAENTFYRLSKVTWPILKIFLILFLIIYFFGVISHDSFCSVMNEVQDLRFNDRPSGVNDDTATYFKFSDILSFRSYFMSLFTLFEISILGTWSGVMDSAALVSPASSYTFFYIVRLVTTLSIYPFLISIIIKVVRTLENENNDRNIVEKKAATLFRELNSTVNVGGINRISKKVINNTMTLTDLSPDATRITTIEMISRKCYDILCLMFSPSIPTCSHLSINPNPLIIDLGNNMESQVDNDEDDGCVCNTLYYKFRSCNNYSLSDDEFYLKFVQEVLCNNAYTDNNIYYNTSPFAILKSRIDLTIATMSLELEYYDAVQEAKIKAASRGGL